MKPDEINAATAESLGWHFDAEFPEYPWIDSEGEGHRSYPNYHGSLDAIVPVVRAMDNDDKETVTEWLMDITKEFTGLATPAEWCEAYLQWKGLWK